MRLARFVLPGHFSGDVRRNASLVYSWIAYHAFTRPALES